MHDTHLTTMDAEPRSASIQWRELSIKAGHRSYTQFYSHRTYRRYFTRSRDERHLLLLIEGLTDVRDAALWPAVINYCHEGIEHIVEPIIWLRRTGAEEFWFSNSQVDRPSGQLRALNEQLLPLRYRARSINLVRVLRPQRIELASTIRRYSKQALDPLLREQTRRELCSSANVILHDVIAGRRQGLQANAVCRLIFEGAAKVFPPGRLTPETTVVSCENLGEV